MIFFINYISEFICFKFYYISTFDSLSFDFQHWSFLLSSGNYISDSCLNDLFNFEFKENCLKYVTKDLHSLIVFITAG